MHWVAWWDRMVSGTQGPGGHTADQPEKTESLCCQQLIQREEESDWRGDSISSSSGPQCAAQSRLAPACHPLKLQLWPAVSGPALPLSVCQGSGQITHVASGSHGRVESHQTSCFSNHHATRHSPASATPTPLASPCLSCLCIALFSLPAIFFSPAVSFFLSRNAKRENDLTGSYPLVSIDVRSCSRQSRACKLSPIELLVIYMMPS